jgi:hypothetical protein
MEYDEMDPQRETESRPSFSKLVVASLIIIWIAAGVLGGYAIHEHRVAQTLKAENQQTDAALVATRTQVDDLTARVNALATQMQAQPQPYPAPAANAPVMHRQAAANRTASSRWKKMQSQLDAQNKSIEDTRNQLAQTQGDLSNTRTELTGSIARTHDDLVLLEKKGERNYYEFDVDKSKLFQHDGPVGVRLRKANSKHEYADLELIVDDRTVSQKHVSLYQPVMFYTPDAPQPLELVINNITKDHIHGYVSAAKYRQSELASMSNANANGSTAGDAAASNPTPVRQKLPAPQ